MQDNLGKNRMQDN